MAVTLDGSFASFLRELSFAAAGAMEPYYRDLNLEVERKNDDSPVTIADRSAEQRMREMIQRRFPDHGIIGEEWGTENADASHVWMLDPIDGTVSFAGGVPLFTTLIALLQDGVPVLGAIHQPVLNQFCIGDGSQTRLNNQAVRVRQQPTLETATLLTTCTKNIDRYQNLDAFLKLVNRVRVFRTWGDAYGYLLLASGWADVMVDPVMNPWDIAPLAPVVRGAGGSISSWSGENVNGASSCVATAPNLHEDVVQILNDMSDASENNQQND